MNETIQKLKSLHQSMDEYWKYLSEKTYHPYLDIQAFTLELEYIINEIEKER